MGKGIKGKEREIKFVDKYYSFLPMNNVKVYRSLAMNSRKVARFVFTSTEHKKITAKCNESVLLFYHAARAWEPQSTVMWLKLNFHLYSQ